VMEVDYDGSNIPVPRRCSGPLSSSATGGKRLHADGITLIAADWPVQISFQRIGPRRCRVEVAQGISIQASFALGVSLAFTRLLDAFL